MFRFSLNHLILFFFLFTISNSALSQITTSLFLKPSDTLNKPRRNTVVIAEASLGVTALIGLNQLWYNDYEQSNFHFKNDNDDWNQMDKLGHLSASYHVGRAGADLLNWAGVREKDQLIYGATLGLTFLTVVEVFDGYSEEWGFSWGDMTANVAGTGLYVGQELLWNEQRIIPKFSFHQTKYADVRPELLGSNFLEQSIKDYNGQTYWLSANVHSFFKKAKVPKWLNVAIGYGADGVLTGSDDVSGMIYSNHDRIRQYYLSLDMDLSRIKTNSRVLKSLLSAINFIKIPAPALEIDSKGRVKLHSLYF